MTSSLEPAAGSPSKSACTSVSSTRCRWGSSSKKAVHTSAAWAQMASVPQPKQCSLLELMMSSRSSDV